MATTLKPDAAQQTTQLCKCGLFRHNCTEAEGGRGDHYATLQQHSRILDSHPKTALQACMHDTSSYLRLEI